MPQITKALIPIVNPKKPRNVCSATIAPFLKCETLKSVYTLHTLLNKIPQCFLK